MHTYKNYVYLKFLFILFATLLICANVHSYTSSALAQSRMPFYRLTPQHLVLRSKFYTSFSASTEERKTNITVATRSLDKTLVPPNAEFSFNLSVGPRTEARGYKTSKIIVGGQFIDGVGGGVCQVSTTLYNALLLAGLTILEYHPHSLPVSYVAPSFDAMVSFGSADLKFVNNTKNPIVIHAYVYGATLFVEIYGEPMQEKYVRQSVITEELPPPVSQEVFDDKLEYPNLYQGEKLVVKYGKAGLKSEGYLIVTKNGKPIRKTKLRTDTYKAIQGLTIIGTAPLPTEIII